MGLTLANPLGLLALLAVPAILAIHLFQRRSRRLPISTLFLLEAAAPRSQAGRTRERLRSSLSLWLQLAAAAAATWLLIQPRWVREDSVERVAVVVDASISMEAFRAPAGDALEALTAHSSARAARHEWTLLPSWPGEGTLYSGADAAEMLRRLRAWEPRHGSHDPRPALRAARGAVGIEGRVVFLTDHPAETEAGVETLAVGAPIENVGFAGVRTEDDAGTTRWRALVHNYGAAPATRVWRVRVGGAEQPGGTVTLRPGASEAISGGFPTGVDAATIALDRDAFAVDDVLPLVRQRPKPLTVFIEPEARERPFVVGLLATLDASQAEPESGSSATRDTTGVADGGAPPDLVVASRGPGALDLPPGVRHAVVFQRAGRAEGSTGDGPVMVENDPLMEDLSWQGLLLRGSGSFPPGPGDRVLLWQGSRPIVFLRAAGESSILVFAFDVERSNADRLPAFVLLFHRYAESVRRAKIAPQSANTELDELLDLAIDPVGPTLRLTEAPRAPGAGPARDGGSGRDGYGADGVEMPAARAALLRAPGRPGFFTVRQGTGRLLLTAAAHFADVREADFREAASRDGTRGADRAASLRHSRPDPLAPLWTLVLAGLLVADWAWASKAA